ncbi:hypothetical protein FY036_18405 [Mesorhizobium microcysteis]|uniref:Uncharacterized protein n=1 Tax=Neoaquamicrobium microcysteis TaxID=2682781 RepID=A0A5D4GPA8_9HYPH|nr:hypothetical protein [Mesorhizobium microcysteis]TYR30681.1 hypothetical protein FY036_18405 [Mesorhizobium microcysteis]
MSSPAAKMAHGRNARLLLMAAGFTIWAVAFIALYGMLSVGCRFGWDRIDAVAGISVQRLQLLVLFAVHVAAGVALAVGLRPPFPREGAGGHFVRWVGYWAAVAALGSTVFSFAGVFALTACY